MSLLVSFIIILKVSTLVRSGKPYIFLVQIELYLNPIDSNKVSFKWILHFVILDDCFIEASVKKSYVSKPYMYELSDPFECQAKCQERPECRYFQLTCLFGKCKCYLKNERAKENATPNECCTFGPKYCGGRLW